MNKIFLLIISLTLLISCTKSEMKEKIEVNKILNTILKYESKRNSFNANYKFLINPEFQKLKIYVPSQKEILGEEPGPPPFFNRNIIRLLDLKGSKFKNRKSDSINLLKQNIYIFNSLYIDTKINSNIQIANKQEIDKRVQLYQFSNPVYFNDNFVYIESIYRDSVFGIGFGYLLEKQKDGSWIIKEITNTFIT
ncbi:hypothetical protein PGH12_18770 [Chryseobacterium wangxinyae]|uniref:hypothetical protein n=1 Tax=Chryseobacterium sp. CY350 TaxID=2997336 RepID=UPI00227055F7|nr:hypothetical protein [Chryseobacterium sp. CY350]MCY0977502.1 hypothetical protein [Chryseobacterium sp. CY350]WBZ95487.1 hypothetical protein PGH12_18770 [Chryseobacterium sp. CY350]